jgi:hypothetical protein
MTALVENKAALRAGDLVAVRSATEILETLDANGELDGIPFMPEMLRYIGGQFRVATRALKVCGPSDGTEGGGYNHHLQGVVFLEQLRCDGSAHGGCEAECRLFWKEEWLRHVGELSADGPRDEGAITPLQELTEDRVRWLPNVEGTNETVFRCQATALRSKPLVKWTQPTQYVRELTSKNVGPLHFVRIMSRAFFREVGKKLHVVKELPFALAGGERLDGETLGLEPGDWVEVRAPDEIGRTLDENGKHRGLQFHYEMIQHCGKQFRVRRRVSRLIDEGTGRMLELRNDCIALEGVVCTGNRATRLWFCRRDLYPFWREAWLRRIDPPRQP